MHTLLRVVMTDVVMANDAIKEGKLGPLFQRVSQMIKPDATFFYSENGCRACCILFDMKDVSMIPQIAEPFFTELNAKVEFLPGMYPNELSVGLDAWKKESAPMSALS
jgi:hypothetical protein